MGVMEIVNEVLSVTQEALWARLERDDVLHVLAVRFSLAQLVAASHLLKEWIGWRADREDVVETLVFEDEEEPAAGSCDFCDGARGAGHSPIATITHTKQHPCFSSSPKRNKNFSMEEEVIRADGYEQDGVDVSREVRGGDRQWEPMRKMQRILMKQEGSDLHTGGCRSLSSHGSSDISDPPKFVHHSQGSAGTADDDCRKNYKTILIRPATSKIPVIISTKTTPVGDTVEEIEILGHEQYGRTEVSEKMVKCSTPADDDHGSVDSVREAPRSRRGAPPWLGMSCGSERVAAGNGDQHSSSGAVEMCTACGGLNPPSYEEAEHVAQSFSLWAPTTVEAENLEQQPNTPSKSLCPERWFLLHGKGAAVPLVTYKIWKLMKIFWNILPEFVGSKTLPGSPGSMNRVVDKEITGINRLFEQLLTRIEGILPVINDENRTVVDHDRSVQEYTIHEELHQLKSWVVRLYDGCLMMGLNSEEFSCDKYHEANLGTLQPFDNCSTNYSYSSEGTDSHVSHSSFNAEEHVKGRYSSPFSPKGCPDIIKDDLLCWLWQAIRSDMDEDLTVHILASHYSLQEVHHSRNILASYNFSVSYMKGMRGLLYEMLWVLRSAKGENNNTPMPKFVNNDVTNRPSVRPVKWTSITRDLEFMSDMAQKITTQICWLLPEAQRYSSAMEAAGKGTLTSQLFATTSTLNNLKTILDWELGTLLNSTVSECIMAPQPVVCAQPTFTPDPYSGGGGRFSEYESREKLQYWRSEDLVSRCCRGGGVGVSSLHQPTTTTHHHTSCQPTHTSSHLRSPQVKIVKPINLPNPQPLGSTPNPSLPQCNPELAMSTGQDHSNDTTATPETVDTPWRA